MFSINIYFCVRMECHKSKDALLQHVKRVAYQAGIWCTSEQHTRWGWTLEEDSQSWVPLCGIRYPWPPRPAANWLNVAARVKKDVVLGAHAERQIGSAQNSVVVIVRSNFFINYVNHCLFHLEVVSPTNRLPKKKKKKKSGWLARLTWKKPSDIITNEFPDPENVY